MKYRGLLNIDFTHPDANQQTRLSLALRKIGWRHVETSAFTRDSQSIDDLWEGIGLVAKYANRVGILSALTFHIQGAKSFNKNVSLKSTQSPTKAVADIKQLPFPNHQLPPAQPRRNPE